MIYPYRGRYPSIHKSVFLAGNVDIIGDVLLEQDVSVWFGTVIRGDVNSVRIGKRTNIQDNCTLHVSGGEYALSIAEDVTVGHAAVLHGCTLQRGCLIGMGATVLDGATVGAESLVAAGALVREHFEIPPGTLVAGVPARIIRELDEEEVANLRKSAANYHSYVDRYREADDLDRGMTPEQYFMNREQGQI